VKKRSKENNLNLTGKNKEGRLISYCKRREEKLSQGNSFKRYNKRKETPTSFSLNKTI